MAGGTLLLFVVAACSMPTDEGVGSTSQAGMHLNGLHLNGLHLNGMHLNGLHLNGLTSNALNLNGLHLNGLHLNGLIDDPDAQMFLKYVYSCAMPPEASEELVLEDELGNYLDTVVLQGALGLAPEWGAGSCNLKCQMWVSACLLARSNALGVPVLISLRGDGIPVGEEEMTEFPLREGTYYGNVFRTENVPGVGEVLDPHLYACSGPDSNKGMLSARFCSGADTGEACRIQVAGPCTCPDGTLDCAAERQGACDNLRETDGTPSACWTPIEDNSDVRKYNEAITIYLSEPLADCGDLKCDPDETPISCPYDCFNHAWAVLPGLISKDSTIELASVPDGTVIVAGTFWDTLDFGSAGFLTADTSHQITPGWDSPGFLAKIDPRTGTAQWATAYGTEISSVATDADGNVFVAGASGSDYRDVKAWIAKLPPTGNPANALWQVELRGAVPPIGLGVDLNGDVVVGGSFYEKLYYDGENQPRLETSRRTWATFLGKLSGGDASPMWMENIAAGQSAPHDRWSALAVGPGQDDIYLTGAAGSWCGSESCLEKYSSDGALIWSVPLAFTEATGTIYGNPRDAAVAEDGTVYVTGRLLAASGEPRDVFIARYDGDSATAPTGPMWWSHIVDSGFNPGDTLAEATEVVLTDDGEAVLAGSFPKSPEIGATTYYDGALGDVDDIYTAGFGGETGDREWVRHAGGAFQDYVEALAVAPGGRIVIAGRFVGSMLFEGTLLEIPADVATANPDSWGLFIGSYLGQPDDNPPTLDLPDDITAEAQGADGAAVSYTATATDLLDGPVEAVCDPASGSTFAMGPTLVSCSAADSDANEATGSFTVTVVDTTAPELALPDAITAEATGPAGAAVFYAPTASDLVDGPVGVTCVPPSGSTFGLTTTAVTCSATDSNGQTATGSFEVTVVDTTPPVVTAPADITDVEATGPNGASVTFGAATAVDLVSGALAAPCSPASGSTFALGTTVVTCTATDGAGLSGSDTFSVTVVDGTAPELSLPGDITGVEATGPAGAAVTYDAATAEDIVDGTLDVSCTPASGSTFAVGTTEVTCTATDSASHTATGSFSVTVVDTTPPVVTLPADLPGTVEATSGSGAMVTFGAATAWDIVDLAVTPVGCSPASGSTFGLGITVVTCSATDEAGNTGSASFPVTVVDTTPPVVAPLADIVAEAAGPEGAVVAFAPGVALDAVEGALSAPCTPPGGSLFGLGDTVVTCTAVDAAGNAGSASFLVSVVDTTAPVVTPPADITEVEATGPDGAVVTYADATATDAVGVASVSCAPASGSTFAVGITEVTCTATDAAGNPGSASFQVEVVDTTAPKLLLPPADLIFEADGPDGAFISYEVSATDTVSTNLVVECSPASGDLLPLGDHIVECSVEDDAHNFTEGTFLVTVEDTKPPALHLPADIVDVEATGPGGAAVTYAASASDSVDTAVAFSCTPASGSTFAVTTTTVTCTGTDFSGNTASATFTVTVLDTTPPAVTTPDDLTLEAVGAEGAVVDYEGQSAEDLVDGVRPVTCEPASGTLFALGVTPVTCSATDTRGNEGFATFNVTVADTTAPVLGLPEGITVEATGPDGAEVTYTALGTDLVDGTVPVACFPASGSVFELGETTVLCTAVDAEGNPAFGSFPIVVEDTTAPTITVPDSPVVADYASEAGTAVTYAASATDIVDGDLDVSCTPASGSLFEVGVTPVTCTSVDAAGNTATASFDVEVHYTWSGFASPLDNATKLFKLGSNIAVKFALTDEGAPVTDLYATLWIAQVIDGEVTGEWAPASSASSVEGNEFRYSPSSGEYIFDLSTDNMTVGKWQLRAELYDGAERTTEIRLKP